MIPFHLLASGASLVHSAMNPATLADAAERWARARRLQVPPRGTAAWQGMFSAWQRSGISANPCPSFMSGSPNPELLIAHLAAAESVARLLVSWGWHAQVVRRPGGWIVSTNAAPAHVAAALERTRVALQMLPPSPGAGATPPRTPNRSDFQAGEFSGAEATLGSAASSRAAPFLSILEQGYGGGRAFSRQDLAREASNLRGARGQHLSPGSVSVRSGHALHELERLGYVERIGKTLGRTGRPGPMMFTLTKTGEERAVAQQGADDFAFGENVVEKQVAALEAQLPPASGGAALSGSHYRPSLEVLATRGHKLPALQNKRIKAAGYRTCNPAFLPGGDAFTGYFPGLPRVAQVLDDAATLDPRSARGRYRVAGQDGSLLGTFTNMPEALEFLSRLGYRKHGNGFALQGHNLRGAANPVTGFGVFPWVPSGVYFTTDAVRTFKREHDAQRLASKLTDQGVPTKEGRGFVSRSIYAQANAPRSKKCRTGFHDFEPATGLCRRAGCDAFHHAGQATMFGRDLDPTAVREALIRQALTGQGEMFTPRPNPTLWRASDDDILPTGAASFARRRSDAEAYLANRGFGGGHLYRSRVTPAPGDVLNIYESRRPLDDLVRLTGLPHPGAIGVEEWIPQSVHAQDSLRALGYKWVVLRDSFPENAETWMWIGPGHEDPDLERVANPLTDAVRTFKREHDAQRLASKLTDQGVPTKEGRGFVARSIYAQSNAPRSKKCRTGFHDFEPVTGLCRRAGCDAFHHAGQATMFGRDLDPTAVREARERERLTGQRDIFANPRRKPAGLVQVVLGRVESEMVPDGPWRADLGERPKMRSVSVARVLMWKRDADDSDIAKANAYALREGYQVLAFPQAERDPLGAARAKLLSGRSINPITAPRDPGPSSKLVFATVTGKRDVALALRFGVALGRGRFSFTRPAWAALLAAQAASSRTPNPLSVLVLGNTPPAGSRSARAPRPAASSNPVHERGPAPPPGTPGVELVRAHCRMFHGAPGARWRTIDIDDGKPGVRHVARSALGLTEATVYSSPWPASNKNEAGVYEHIHESRKPLEVFDPIGNVTEKVLEPGSGPSDWWRDNRDAQRATRNAERRTA